MLIGFGHNLMLHFVLNRLFIQTDEKFSDDHPVRQVQESTDCHENPDSRSSDLGRQQDYTNHGLRETKEENPKQDFSRIRLLKEVKFDS